MKSLKKIFESTLLIEAKKKLMVIDTNSGMDSEKVIEILKKDKIKFEKTGSIISIKIDPSSAPAAVLRSHLHKNAKFDEIKEKTVLLNKKNDLIESAASKKGTAAVKNFQKALKKAKIAYARPEFIGNWRYSDTNESWGIMSETDSGLEVYILFSYFPGDGEITYSLYDGKNTSESNSIGISHNYMDATPAAFKEMVKDIKEDLDDLDETVNLESVSITISESALDRYKAAKGKGGDKSSFECMECGAKFKKKLPKSGEVKCPKCGSSDLEVD